ncbi:GntR family transcriptional regulator [Maribacter polysaccharolyticus]|uniref:GntR family transcriptional regulator n=1 Tax=Maribacter polysaccharolyticus TaxID=3020831 RepID=UPI00237F273E|nr:GntR family transcriptional regulator [Maribacter polysaccharolyticus]MDE3742668.1 GntR family transcriptional regulator [Maribacter polysaccharolyticus]
MGIINIEQKKGTPKYKQIIASIEEAIIDGKLKKGDQLPSINFIRDTYKLSRDTVLMAFNELKARGIIQSVVGKGYYVLNEDITVSQKIFLLFDELNSFKEDLYNSFLENLEENIKVEIFFHHFNPEMFNNLIYESNGNYNYYVIMPANLKQANSAIEILPKDKVYILDQIQDNLVQYAAIYQNFEKDIINNLSSVLHLIENYRELILLFNPDRQPQGMLDGFNKFCASNGIENSVIQSLQGRIPKKGEVYIIPDDKDLLRIIKRIKEAGLVLSKDIGIISYNDTLLKEIVEGGITTISTDFYEMGNQLAKMILSKEKRQIENTSNLILRNSL